MNAFQVVGIVVACLGLFGLGWGFCLVMVARDRRVVTIKEGDVVVRGEVFEKLVNIAQIRLRAPEVRFDKKGQVRKEFDPAGGEYGEDLDREAGVEVDDGRKDNPPG